MPNSQPTQPAPDEIPTNPTTDLERDADELLARLAHLRLEADTPADPDARRAWAAIARLALRLHARARTIGRTLADDEPPPSARPEVAREPLDVFSRAGVSNQVLAALDMLLDLNSKETPSAIELAVGDVYAELSVARTLLDGGHDC